MQQLLTDNSLDPRRLLVNESLFAQGNGYLGVRGNFEEGYGSDMQSIRGCYLNAFYDVTAISYGEKCTADPDTQQKLPNLPDAQTVELLLGEGETQEVLSLFSGEVLDFERTLDLATGVATRRIHWRSPLGRELKLTVRRLVSFVRKELLAIDYQLQPVNFHGQLTVRSTINGEVENFTASNDPRVAAGHARLMHVSSTQGGEIASVMARTGSSGLEMAVNCQHRFATDQVAYSADERQCIAEACFTLDQPRSFSKLAIYTDSRRHTSPASDGAGLLAELCDVSFEQLIAEQQAYLTAFWRQADITIDGESGQQQALQEGLRFNLFQLLQSTGREPTSNIAAKGLSGEGYEGHYFWDTEIYVFPVMLLTRPELAKNLLLFRYHTLDGARQRAREMGHSRGALYPWRTISGSECSAYFPAGTAQYHINADIAWAFVQYYKATDDLDFMATYGAEVLFETARLWLDAGHFGRDGRFRIDAVTGPDEYTAIVNNNYYTNAMARHHLQWAVKLCQQLETARPESLTALREQLALSAQESEQWALAAEQMYLPHDSEREITPQDDSFLDKKRWDFANTPAEHHPLLLHYHPLTLYRHQVCKQPDVLLAHYLLDGIADEQLMANSYDFYEPLTTHDSSLSSCVFSIQAARLGRLDKAVSYFNETARLDLDNTHGNTRDGLHIANLAGTWQGMVYGFGGVRLGENHLRLAPRLPASWDGYSFRITWRGRVIEAHVCHACTRIQLLSGAPFELEVHGKMLELKDKLEVATRL